MPLNEIVIHFRSHLPARRAAEPVTCGVPFAKGTIRDPKTLQLVDCVGEEQPLQTRVLDRWADGSARWVLCDWRATVAGNATYRIRVNRNGLRSVHECGVPSLADASGPDARGPLGEVEIRQRLEAIGSRLVPSESIRLVSEGRDHNCLPDFDWFIESEGPLRISVLERGCFTHNGINIARYALRTHHFANSPVVRVHFTITNPNRAQHPGGMWDLGDPRSVLISNLIIPLQLEGPDGIRGQISPEVGAPFQQYRGLFLHQASSGGENWRSSNHVTRSGSVALPFRGYSLDVNARDSVNERPAGRRSTPIVNLSAGDKQLSLSVPQFWQNFPMAIDGAQGEIWLNLFPGHAGPHELQPGEQKEHVFYVAFGHDTITENPLEWTRDPLVPVVDPDWIASTGAIPYFTSQASDPYRDYQLLADAAIEGDDTFEKKREVIDEYGWRHFGDIYGDHEAILHTEFGPKPRVSHYNNQYDAIAGFAIHWLRSGDAAGFVR